MAFDFPSSPTTGQTYSVSGGPTYVYNGTAWVVLTPGNQFNRTVFTATAGQTTFSMNYVVGAIDVYRNGVKLVNTSDFTATNGTSIVLLNAATVGDTIEVISYPMITYSDAVKRTGDVMTGSLAIRDTSPALYLQSSAVNDTRAFFQFDSVNNNTVIDSDYSLSFNTNNIERMRIDVSGRVTMPYQPAFTATATGTTQAAGVLQFNSTSLNIGNCFNTSTYRFTAPIAGNYYFYVNTIGTSGDYQAVSLNKNGSRVSGFGWGGTPASTESSANIAMIVQLAVGDYVTASCSRSAYNAGYNQFTGFLVG